MGLLINAFGYARIAVGAGTWAFPSRAIDLFGIKAGKTTAGNAVVYRLFGIREAVLGLAYLGYFGSEVLVVRAALKMGLVCDLVDTVACAIAYKDGAFNASGIVLTWMGAAFFAGLGNYCLGAGF